MAANDRVERGAPILNGSLAPGPGSTKWAANLWFHEADTSAGTMGVQSRLYKQGKVRKTPRLPRSWADFDSVFYSCVPARMHGVTTS